LKKLLPLNESVLVFLHIKKTGGISLQKLIQDQYPDKFYGNDHSVLKKKIKIKKSVIEDIPNGSAVANHWTYDDFKCIKDRCNFVTIVRNPVDRIISAYNFYKKFSEEKLGFSDYINLQDNTNVMSRVIGDIRNMSEIYLLERLRDDLRNSSVLKAYDILHMNRTTYTDIKGRYSFYPSSNQISEFIGLNSKDIDLYEEINRR